MLRTIWKIRQNAHITLWFTGWLTHAKLEDQNIKCTLYKEVQSWLEAAMLTVNKT